MGDVLKLGPHDTLEVAGGRDLDFAALLEEYSDVFRLDAEG
jgi:hypothetical protein